MNSQARLWVLGAQVHPWLLSHRDFPGIRCCLDTPVEWSHVSHTGKGPADCPPRQPGCHRVGPGLPQGVGGALVTQQQGQRGWQHAQSPGLTMMPWSLLPPHRCQRAWLLCGWGGARTLQGHLPCFLWPRSLLGVLCVLGGQHLPGKFWRNQPHVLRRWHQAGACLDGPARAAARVGLRGPPAWEGLCFLLVQKPGQPGGGGARELGQEGLARPGRRWFGCWGHSGTEELPEPDMQS